MGWGGLHPAYQKRAEEAAGRHRYLKSKARNDEVFMAMGPRLEGDMLVIPSNWYNPEAKDFWRSLGARFDSGDLEQRWILDTRRARYNGRRYTRWAWLRSARRKFGEFYPELELEGCDD